MPAPAVLGLADGQPTLLSRGPVPELGARQDVVPELEEAVQAAKPMWKHPAFIVSMILTVLALAAAGVFAALSIFGAGAGSASGADITLTPDNAHLTWQSTGEVSLYAVTGETVADLSQLIVSEGQAWVPSALGLYDSTTCFVIRPSELGDAPVSLGADQLAAQHATSACASQSSAE